MTPTMLPQLAQFFSQEADRVAPNAQWLTEYAQRSDDVNSPEAAAARAAWSAIRLLRTAAAELNRRGS